MKLVNLSAILLTLISITWLSSCSKKDISESSEPNQLQKKAPGDTGYAENDMVMHWNEKAAIVITGPFTPPAQQRYMAIIQIAVHDALNSIKPKFQTHALNNHREKFANPDAAVASAAYHTIKALSLGGAHPLDSWYSESMNTVPDGEGKELGKTLGQAAANAIILLRSTDNFSIANQQLPRPEGVAPGEYRSTLPFSNVGMPKIKALHLWGNSMKTFVIQNSSQFRPPAPYPVSSLNYAQDYNEVKLKGGRVGHTRNANETEIGVFWVERSTLGWNRFARTLIGQRKIDAWKTARLLALMHTGMADGITACFEAKYHYLYWRPETAIRMGNTDGNDLTSGDASWLPGYTESPNANPLMNIYTPPIAEYPSAHANFGGSAAAILTRFFESDNISANLTSTTLPGVVRNYSSIATAARDNSLSRIYVGYHFRKAIMAGEEQGWQVGNYVFENSFKENE